METVGKRFLKWLFHFVCGFTMSMGISLLIWMALYAIFEKPAFTLENMLFLAIVAAIPWFINFIFHFSSSITVKGILHAILWLILGLIVYNLLYQTALPVEILCLVIFVFGVLYALCLWRIVVLSKKLNTPFRHIAEFLGKYAKSLENK